MFEAVCEATRSVGTLWSLIGVMALCFPAAIAVHEFTAYRMNQFDIGTTQYGCRSNVVNYEARAVNANIVTRRCVLLSMGEVTVDRVRELIAHKTGSILITVPKNMAELSSEEKAVWSEVEEVVMEQPTDTSIFFTYQHTELTNIHNQVKSGLNSDHAPTAAAALANVFNANGYQIVTYDAAPVALKTSSIFTIQGKLSANTRQENTPSIVIVAHFDSYGIAPHLATSADANGSGVAALMQIASLLSKLYSNPLTVPGYDILFLLTGAGKMNYMGTKSWLDKHIATDSPEGILLSDAEYVLCLDSIGSNPQGLFLHVSKPPKPGTSAYKLFVALQQAATLLYPNITVDTAAKKVNLGNAFFAWHHEIFTVKRISAGTLSQSATVKSNTQTLDNKIDTETLVAHTHILAEALARYLTNTTDETVTILSDHLMPNTRLMTQTINFLSTTLRAASLIHKDSAVLNTLEEMLTKYTKEVLVVETKAAKREPEFTFYDSAETKLYAYNVKPAVFDLFLAFAVFMYLGLVYLSVKGLPLLMTALYQNRKLKSS